MLKETLVGRLATIATITCVAVVALTVAALVRPGIRPWLGLPSARPLSYSAGARIDVPAALYTSSPQTLLLFVRSTCSACQAGKPIFAKIAAQLRQRGVPTVIVASGAHTDDESTYVKDLGLEPSQLVAVDLTPLRLQVVPTLVLVARNGDVMASSEGVPTDVQQQEFLQAATSSTTAR